MTTSVIETSPQQDVSTVVDAPYDFWQVDCLLSRVNNHGKKSFIENFIFDSMTSSPRKITTVDLAPTYTRRLMRGPSLRTEIFDMSIAGTSRPVYFIGQWPHLEEKIVAWDEWVSGGMKTKMPTQFGEYFSGDHTFGFPVVPVVAWWGIEEDLVWTLNSRVAEALIDMLTER